MKFRYESKDGEFAKAMTGFADPMATAGAAAVKEATAIAHKRGQAQIAAARLGTRWVQSFKQKFYANDGLDAAGIVYSTINFSVVFERGAVIKGNPTLWIPLPTTPVKYAGKRLTAKVASEQLGFLFKIAIGGREYLAVRVAVSKRTATGPLPRMTASMLKSRARKPRKGETTRLIPLFVGKKATTIRDRLDIRGIAEDAANQLGALFAQNIRDE
jgi:hypothetical protein